MTRGRKKWRVRLAFEPNRYAREQLQKAYEADQSDRSTRNGTAVHDAARSGQASDHQARRTMSKAAMVAL
jgi:hypothetical protein